MAGKQHLGRYRVTFSKDRCLLEFYSPWHLNLSKMTKQNPNISKDFKQFVTLKGNNERYAQHEKLQFGATFKEHLHRTL